MTDKLGQILQHTAEIRPMVHSITNNVTINDCANIILAAGGTAIMAQDEREVEEITANSAALALNMGALRAQEAMLLAAREAKRLGHPVVLDPVAAGASRLRSEMCSRLLADGLVSVIRGNASEIRALAEGRRTAGGVDADEADVVTGNGVERDAAFVKAFSEQTGCVIAMTGAMDLIADKKRCFLVRNGRQEMSRVTGTGCQLSGMMCAYLAANPEHPLEAAVSAVCAMGLAGELAWSRMREDEGNAAYRNRIIDAIYLMSGEELERGGRMELL